MPSGRASRRSRASGPQQKANKRRTVRSGQPSAGNASPGAPPGLNSLTISEIVRQAGMVREVAEHPLRALIFQMGLFSIVTGAVGTLVALFIPEASVNNASNGVYVSGLVLILLIETLYQWMLRAGALVGEQGVVGIAESNYPHVPLDELREYLRTHRDGFEARLRRLFEPIEKVLLIALALLVHLMAQESADISWARELSTDWVITLLLAFAGLLWQLKNPDNIAKLSTELRLERLLSGFGNWFYVVVLTAMTLGSIILLGVVFFPWGFISAAPLGVAFWFTRKAIGRTHINLPGNHVGN